jgi:hypothetical protein
MTAREASRPQRPTLRAESLPNLCRKKALVTRIPPFGQRRPSASVSDTNSGLHAESHWRATLAVRHHECQPKCARLPKPDVMGIGRPAADKARLRAHFRPSELMM